MNHKELVTKLKKSGTELLEEALPKRLDANHMLIGLMGEVGELADAIKKWTIYNQSPNRDNIIEEMGDIEFYLEGLRQNLELDREAILHSNIQKLTVRYGDKFSNEAAKERKDKNEGNK